MSGDSLPWISFPKFEHTISWWLSDEYTAVFHPLAVITKWNISVSVDSNYLYETFSAVFLRDISIQDGGK